MSIFENDMAQTPSEKILNVILKIRNDGFAATNGAVREAVPDGMRARDDATDPAAARSAAARDGAERGPADGASARRRRR